MLATPHGALALSSVRPIGPRFVVMSTSVVPVGVTSTGGVPVSACRVGFAAVSAGVQSQVPSPPSAIPGAVGAAGGGGGGAGAGLGAPAPTAVDSQTVAHAST